MVPPHLGLLPSYLSSTIGNVSSLRASTWRALIPRRCWLHSRTLKCPLMIPFNSSRISKYHHIYTFCVRKGALSSAIEVTTANRSLSLSLQEKEAIESFDFEKLKTAKHLDLAQYEKSLLQKIPVPFHFGCGVFLLTYSRCRKMMRLPSKA